MLSTLQENTRPNRRFVAGAKSEIQSEWRLVGTESPPQHRKSTYLMSSNRFQRVTRHSSKFEGNIVLHRRSAIGYQTIAHAERSCRLGEGQLRRSSQRAL